MLRIQAFIKNEWAFLVAVALTVIAYSLFFGYGYISWDDPEMVFKNADVQNFKVSAFFQKAYVGNYIPVTMLAHSLIWQVFGETAGWHHAVAILLHIINAWLVLQLGRKLFKSETAAFLASGIFLLHPTQIESIGWIGEFKTPFYSFFFLLALHSYLNSAETFKTKSYYFSILFFILSLLSKPSAVTLPAFLLVIDIFQKQKTFKQIAFALLPFIALAAFFSYVNLETQTKAQFINQAHAFPFWQRILFAGFALVKYLSLFLSPMQLSVIYTYPVASMAVLATGAFILVLLLLLIFLVLKNKQFKVLIAVAMVIVNLLPVLQFIPFGEVLYADRYLYLPLIGFGWLLGFGFEKLKLPVKAVAMPLLIVLSFLSFSRSKDWRTALSLYENVLVHSPNSFVALNSAGVECMQKNEDAKADSYFSKAISDNPRNYKGFYNRGLLRLKTGKAAEAIADFNACLNLNEYAKAYAGRAAAYLLLQDFPKAKQDAEYALRLDAKQAKALFVLAECYNAMNQLEAALSFYNQAIALNANEADYYFKRAIAYGKFQKFDACLSDLEVCLYLNPSYYDAYYWRGVAKVNVGQNACSDFETAAKHNVQQAVSAYYKYCQ